MNTTMNQVTPREIASSDYCNPALLATFSHHPTNFRYSNVVDHLYDRRFPGTNV